MAQKKELTKLVVQVVCAIREGDRVVNEEAGLWGPGPDGPVFAMGGQAAVYTPEQAAEFFAEQEALCKAAQPNRAARRGK